MIDINKMRRLTQAATPGPWVAAGPSFGESLPKYLNEVAVDREGDEDDGYSICNAPIGLNEECSDDMAFIAEANPLTIEELLDRLEAAEKSRDDLLACLGEWLDKTKWVQQGVNEGTISAKYLGLHRADVMSSLLGEAEKERDALRTELNEIRYGVAVAHDTIKALRAKIEQMEKQEAVGEIQRANSTGNYICSEVWVPLPVGAKLYALPGAQPAPSLASRDVSLISEGKTQPALSMPNLHVGNLPTANQDAYPALGAWWVQLWDGDDVFARVYGATPEEAHSRAVMLAAAPKPDGNRAR